MIRSITDDYERGSVSHVAVIANPESARARRVPDEVVGLGRSRPLTDNIAGTAIWLDARQSVAEET